MQYVPPARLLLLPACSSRACFLQHRSLPQVPLRFTRVVSRAEDIALPLSLSRPDLLTCFNCSTPARWSSSAHRAVRPKRAFSQANGDQHSLPIRSTILFSFKMNSPSEMKNNKPCYASRVSYHCSEPRSRGRTSTLAATTNHRETSSRLPCVSMFEVHGLADALVFLPVHKQLQHRIKV